MTFIADVRTAKIADLVVIKDDSVADGAMATGMHLPDRRSACWQATVPRLLRRSPRSRTARWRSLSPARPPESAGRRNVTFIAGGTAQNLEVSVTSQTAGVSAGHCDHQQQYQLAGQNVTYWRIPAQRSPMSGRRSINSSTAIDGSGGH